MSQISDRLLSSAFHIGEMPSGALLVSDNAHYPWFIIVPYGEFVEWIDLSPELQSRLMADINTLSRFLREDPVFEIEKLNVAAIGNIVPQFHLHIVGRRSSDPAWPAPVWGHPDRREFGPGELRAMVERLARGVPDFTGSRGFTGRDAL